MRVMIGVAGWPGHAFPAFALARALRQRGHEVLIETFERWRDVAESLDVRFAPGPERIVFPDPPEPGDDAPTLEQAVQGTVPLIEDFAPDVVIGDLFGIVPSLAAELAGARRVTLVPHVWSEYEDGVAPFNWGFLPARTPGGDLIWRAGRYLRDAQRKRHRPLLNRARERVGLAPLPGTRPPMSDELVMVATYPQLEYPRPRPAHVEVTGPMLFELDSPEVELPPGDDPLVVVAGSTEQDSRHGLIAAALDGLAGEPVRVLATLNRRDASWSGSVPPNARVVDWASYAQLVPQAAAMVTRGGHGTIVRALSEGVPVLVCPEGGDQSENGARVAWSGAGLMLPRRMLAPRRLRLALRRLLAEPPYAARAREIAAWGRDHDGAVRGAELLERLA